MRILLAESNSVFAEALKVRLTKAVEAAGDIKPEILIIDRLDDALTKSVSWEPHITLFDPVMSDSPDWMESLSAIRKGWRGMKAFFPPVIVVTDMPKTQELITACFKAGAQEVYSKPWEMKAVEKLVSDMASAILRSRSDLPVDKGGHG